jgi:putative sterol carrier protein
LEDKLGGVRVDDLMSLLPEFFVPERAAGINFVAAFILGGEKGGDWTVTIRDQKCEITKENPPRSDIKLEADGETVLNIFSGVLNPMHAYMRGQLHVSGNIRLAMKIAELFDVDYERLKNLGNN